MSLKEDRKWLIEHRRDCLVEAIGVFIDAKVTYALARRGAGPLGDFLTDVNVAREALSDAIGEVLT